MGTLRCSPLSLGKEGPGPLECPPGTEAGPWSPCEVWPHPHRTHTPTSGHRAPPSLAQSPGHPFPGHTGLGSRAGPTASHGTHEVLTIPLQHKGRDFPALPCPGTSFPA